MKKRLLTLFVALGVTLGAANLISQPKTENHNNTAYKNTTISARNYNKSNDMKNNIAQGESEDIMEIPTLEDILGDAINKLDASEREKLNKLYEKITKIEIEANGLWNDFDKELGDKLGEDFDWENIECDNGQCEGQDEYGQDVEIDENFDFNQFLEVIKEQLKPETYNKIQKLYEQIVKLEAKEDYEKADSLWEQIDKTLENSNINFDDMSQGMAEMAPGISFEIKNGKIVYSKDNKGEKPSNEMMKKYEQIWERAKKLIPKSYMNRIGKFQINSDGKDGILAFVEPTTGIKVWSLSIDDKDAFDKSGKKIDKELDNTIIHEFAHILTLNDSQMLKTRNENSKTYTTDEGTTKENSYLNKFYQKFWKGIQKEWEKAQNSEDANYKFYEKYKNSFVSDYAATNPGEDIAESFRVFVTQDKPKGNSIKDQKVLFFYNFDEAVKLRAEIRSNLK